MSDDDMYWPDKYPWSRRPAPRTPARAPVMFRVILTHLWLVFISGARAAPWPGRKNERRPTRWPPHG